MMVVFHAKAPNFGRSDPDFPEEYEKVATVDTNDIEIAYMQTNNITQSWVKNKDVTAFVTEARSTSVGDVVLDNEGRLHRCSNMGWEEIEKS